MKNKIVSVVKNYGIVYLLTLICYSFVFIGSIQENPNFLWIIFENSDGGLDLTFAFSLLASFLLLSTIYVYSRSDKDLLVNRGVLLSVVLFSQIVYWVENTVYFSYEFYKIYDYSPGPILHTILIYFISVGLFTLFLKLYKKLVAKKQTQ